MGRLASCLKPLSAALLACGLASNAQAATPTVVAGDGVLCDLTRTLSGGATDVRCLIAPGADPHHLQLTPANRKDISQSQVVLINGYGLTPTLARLQGAFTLISVGEEAVPNNPSLDPHLWHSPINTKAMAGVVSKALQQLPISAESQLGLQRRLSTTQTILSDLDRWNRQQIATIPAPHRVVVAEHLAFGFFTDRYGLPAFATLQLQ